MDRKQLTACVTCCQCSEFLYSVRPRCGLTPLLTRRELLRTSGLGFGGLALSALVHAEESRKPHFEPRAKSIIMLVQNGGPSQMDLFDHKPELTKKTGAVHGTKVEMFQKGSEANKLLATPFTFRRYGKCGMELSEVIPHLGSVADDVCLVRSMFERNNHTEGLVLLNTGKIFPGRPAAGRGSAMRSTRRTPARVHRAPRPRGYNTSGTLLCAKRLAAGRYRRTEVSMQGPPCSTSDRQARGPGRTRADLDAWRAQRRAPQALTARGRAGDADPHYELAARMQLAAGDVSISRRSQTRPRRCTDYNANTAGYGLRA